MCVCVDVAGAQEFSQGSDSIRRSSDCAAGGRAGVRGGFGID